MSAPEYARLASRLFVRDGCSMPDQLPLPETRAEAIATIAAAIAGRARRRRMARWMAGAVGTAAMVTAAVGVSRLEARRTTSVALVAPVPSAPSVQITAHPVGGIASVVVSGSQAPLADGRAVAEGSRLVTPPDGRATLAFSTGTSVIVGEGTDVTLGGEGEKQLLRLNGGWVDLHVAKLGAGQQFLVDTPDSEVEVRGTRFRVSVVHADAACGGGTTTRVSVTEGVVVVRHANVESSVAAGEQWPAACVATAGTLSAVAGRSSLDSPWSTSAGAGPASTLAEQNNLFGEALGYKRQGDVRQALASFERFLTEYPASALTESASAERMRLLRMTASSHAFGAARRYLASYPNGFAHTEAEAILADVP